MADAVDRESVSPTENASEDVALWSEVFRTRATLVIAGLLALMASTVLVIDVLQGFWGFVVVEGFGLAALAVVLQLNRSGQQRLASYLMMGAMWSLVSVALLIGDGLWSIAIVYLVLTVVLAGLLLERRGLVVWTGAGLLTCLVLAVSHLSGVSEAAQGTASPLNRAIELALALVICGVAMGAIQGLQQQIIQRLQDEIRERRRAEAAALGAAQAKERFLATMSPELRTPLNGILGAACLLPDTSAAGEREELVGMITSSADLLLALVNDILDYSRMSSESLSLELLPLQPAALLEEVCAPLRLLAAQKGVRLQLSVGDGLPDWIADDSIRLRQIVLNLVSNAIKFTAVGQVAVHADAHGERWILTVRDTGIGIAPDAQARLFEPFAQADASTTRRFGGTGLGLAIVHRIIERMAGTIAVDSSLGAGAAFTVTLPLRPATAPAPVRSEPDASRSLTALRILLVDDHPINRAVTSRMLSRAGHQLTEATNGLEAVAAVAAADWDVVLMDCQMPVCDGYEATARIRAMEPPRGRVTILGLSANTLPEQIARAMAAGMDDYLTKPVQPEQLQAALERLRPTRSTA